MEIVSPQTLGFSPERLARANRQLQAYIDQGKLAGAVTLVARRGQIAQLDALGSAVMDLSRAMTTDAIFRIYSMTKPITATAVMTLFEEGRFRLTDPISAYIPSFKEVRVVDPSSLGVTRTLPPNREITIHDLLTHTAGLSYGFDDNNMIDALYRERVWKQLDEKQGDVSLLELVDTITSIPLAYQPGTAWRYSVANDVLGCLVEVVSGQSFGDYLKTRIFDPLGMPDTGFYAPEEKWNRLASVYTPDEQGGLKVDPATDAAQFKYPPRAPMGGGGLLSTAADYWRFAQMMLNRGELDGTRILGRKTVELMTSNALPEGVWRDNIPNCCYGLGVDVVTHLGATKELGSVGKFGWSGAATTHFWVDPAEELIGIVLVQLMPFDAVPLRMDFQNLVYQALD